jgi:hypothetical protein
MQPQTIGSAGRRFDADDDGVTRWERQKRRSELLSSVEARRQSLRSPTAGIGQVTSQFALTTNRQAAKEI